MISCTAQKMKFSIKYFFSKDDQIRLIWSHLLKKSLIENFLCSGDLSRIQAFLIIGFIWRLEFLIPISFRKSKNLEILQIRYAVSYILVASFYIEYPGFLEWQSNSTKILWCQCHFLECDSILRKRLCNWTYRNWLQIKEIFIWGSCLN